MSRKRKPEPYIRRQLLVWLMLPLCGVWLITTAVACWFGADSSRALYDQQLLDSADSVSMRIDIHGDVVSVVIPKAVRTIMEHGVDRFYFVVRDPNGKLLFRDGDIITPEGSPWPEEVYDSIFANGTVNGQPVRVATISIIDEETKRPLILEVAETLNSRNQLTSKIMLNILLSELLVIVIGAFAVNFGIVRGLLPLNSLQSAIAERSTADLRPVPEEDVPTEALPLVKAINDLLDRLKVEIDSQKRFVANAAHQLRTPMAGMKTYLALARRVADTDELRKLMAELDEGTNRLTHLTNRLLSLARAEPNTRRSAHHSNLDMNTVVSDAMYGLVAEALAKEIELGFEPCPNPAMISGSAEELQELVINIVENAIVYTPQGGHVTVRVANTDDVMLAVEDDGPGIPAEEREQVFERFYRVLGTGVSGSGLGLAIVKEIAVAHKASVSIDSGAEGKGTLITVRLPAVH
jgi:two-component system sensor histidine kinase TctE